MHISRPYGGTTSRERRWKGRTSELAATRRGFTQDAVEVNQLLTKDQPGASVASGTGAARPIDRQAGHIPELILSTLQP